MAKGRFRGKAHWVTPTPNRINQALGRGKVPPTQSDAEVSRLLDYVMEVRPDLAGCDKAEVKVWEAVKAEAWDGILALLETQAILKALGRRTDGDTPLLKFLLCNLNKQRWQERPSITLQQMAANINNIRIVEPLPQEQARQMLAALVEAGVLQPRQEICGPVEGN